MRSCLDWRVLNFSFSFLFFLKSSLEFFSRSPFVFSVLKSPEFNALCDNYLVDPF